MLYAVVLLLGVAIALLVPVLDRWLAGRGRTVPSTRWALDVVATSLLVVLVLALVPGSPDTVPADVPAAAPLGLPARVPGAARDDVAHPRARLRTAHGAGRRTRAGSRARGGVTAYENASPDSDPDAHVHRPRLP